MKRIATLLLVLVSVLVRAQEINLHEDLGLKYMVQLPKGNVQHSPIVILLHGYGSNEQDMFGMRSVFPNNYIVVSARAPYDIPTGGYEWYKFAGEIKKLVPDTAQLAKSRKTIEQFVAQVVAKYKADARNVYLGGFSQGAIMSYEVGLSDPGLLKGIIILSGKINAAVQHNVTPSDALRHLKIFIGHGTADDRISIDEAKAAVAQLQKWGARPEYHPYPSMQHTVGDEEINDLLKWLSK